MLSHAHIISTTILNSTVAVVDQLVGSFHIGGHHQGINGSFAVQRGVQFVAHNVVAIGIGNNDQVADTLTFRR